jgi:hypothetical protein
MSYLRFDGVTLKNLCIARPNRGTCKASGPGTCRRDVACARVHASLPRLRRASSYHSRASKSGRALGVRQPRTHLQETPRPKDPRATRRTRARRGAVLACRARTPMSPPYRALNAPEMLSHEARCPARASTIKRVPHLLPHVSTAARRTAIAAAAASSHPRKLPPPANSS